MLTRPDYGHRFTPKLSWLCIEDLDLVGIKDIEYGKVIIKELLD